MATAMQRAATGGTRRVLVVGALGMLLGGIAGGVVGRALTGGEVVPAGVEPVHVTSTADGGSEIEAVRAANYRFEAPAPRLEIEAVRALNSGFRAPAPTIDIDMVRALNFAGS